MYGTLAHKNVNYNSILTLVYTLFDPYILYIYSIYTAMRILTPLKNTLRNILPQTNCILSFVLSYTLLSTLS